jgi:MFS transporter, PHS family, inorganic phosphate transporter
VYGIELIIIIGATFALALSAPGPSLNIVGVMIVWRVIVGLGVGGGYPLSSIITSEFATVKWRGAMMTAVFANQGLGSFAAALVYLICTVASKDSLQVNTCEAACQVALDKSWRMIYGFGAIPAVFALYFRLTIPETIRYTLDVEANFERARADALRYVSGRLGSARLGDDGFEAPRYDDDTVREHLQKASFGDFFYYFGQWKHGKVLLGTAASWFFMDVGFVTLILII